MIIGLSGYMQSGKDTAAQMILETDGYWGARDDMGAGNKWYWNDDAKGWKIKKFAEKLKEVASLMTGIPREKFEDQDFKMTKMPKEWCQWIVKWERGDDGPGSHCFKTREEAEKFIDELFEEPDEVKENKDMFYYDEPTVRQFLQRLGTDAVRNCVHKDAWIIAAMTGYGEGTNWIFTDVRFPNEAQAIKDKGGVIIRLNRYPPGVSPKLMNLHESEISLDDWEFDYIIWNNGTLEDLKNQIREILKQINQKKI